MSGRLILVAAALTFAIACSSSTSPSTLNNGSTNTISIPSGASALTTTAYAPNPMTVSRGTSVSWVNNDNTTHTAVSNDGTTFNSGNIAPGGTFTFTFQNAGTFAYRCTIHPNMVGTVTVQ